MSWYSRLIESMGLTTQSDAAQRGKRAYEMGFEDGNDEPASGDLRSFSYKGMGTGKRQGGIDPDKELSTVWSIYQQSLIADRAMELKRDYLVGTGVRYSVDDELAQQTLDDFWTSNSMDEHDKEFTLQLRLFGTQCYPVFVRETDGAVRLGYIDPEQIEKVMPHPDNAMDLWAVVVKVAATHQKRCYRIVRMDEQRNDGEILISPRFEGSLVTHTQQELEVWELKMLAELGLAEYTGSCLYFRVNAVSNQERGWSDLRQAADWIDSHGNVLFDIADTVQMLSFFFADVTLMGAKKDEVDEKAAEIRARAPSKGSVNVHNDTELWDLKRPDMQQSANIDTADSLFNMIWGGLGFPRHWYTEGDTTNRATAAEQGAPAERTLESDQHQIQRMFTKILTFVLDQAVIAGTLQGSEYELSIILPQVGRRDFESISTTLATLTSSLGLAESQSYITKDKAREMWAKVASELGVDIDPEEMSNEIDEEAFEEDPFNQLIAGLGITAEQPQQLPTGSVQGNGGASVDAIT